MRLKAPAVANSRSYDMPPARKYSCGCKTPTPSRLEAPNEVKQREKFDRRCGLAQMTGRARRNTFQWLPSRLGARTRGGEGPREADAKLRSLAPAKQPHAHVIITEWG